MDRLLDSFLGWFEGFRRDLQARGAWVDAVDPCSGTALCGTRGERWSEVHGANALLGFPIMDGAICPFVLHPRLGTASFLSACVPPAPSRLPPPSCRGSPLRLLQKQGCSARLLSGRRHRAASSSGAVATPPPFPAKPGQAWLCLGCLSRHVRFRAWDCRTNRAAAPRNFFLCTSKRRRNF